MYIYIIYNTHTKHRTVQKSPVTFPNIHFAINCNNPVRFESSESLMTASAAHRDLSSSSSSLSGMTWRNRTNWDRLNPEELWQCLQYISSDLHTTYLQNHTGLLQLMAKWMFGNDVDTLQQKISGLRLVLHSTEFTRVHKLPPYLII